MPLSWLVAVSCVVVTGVLSVVSVGRAVLARGAARAVTGGLGAVVLAVAVPYKSLLSDLVAVARSASNAAAIDAVVAPAVLRSTFLLRVGVNDSESVTL
eukprot:m.312852 g.312852  ORF g.312852 m.312852 type:complete len:99 (+) comp27470_c1_seq15:421-717(+)